MKTRLLGFTSTSGTERANDSRRVSPTLPQCRRDDETTVAFISERHDSGLQQRKAAAGVCWPLRNVLRRRQNRLQTRRSSVRRQLSVHYCDCGPASLWLLFVSLARFNVVGVLYFSTKLNTSCRLSNCSSAWHFNFNFISRNDVLSISIYVDGI